VGVCLFCFEFHLLPWCECTLRERYRESCKLKITLASCKAQEMHIAMLKITSGSCKVQERHIASSKLPWVLAKLKKNAHCKFEITSGSCKAQEMHIACLKLRQALAKLKKFMFDAHMGPTQDQSSLNAVYGTKTSLSPPIDWCVKFSC
jgi:hypothetical protein